MFKLIDIFPSILIGNIFVLLAFAILFTTVFRFGAKVWILCLIVVMLLSNIFIIIPQSTQSKADEDSFYQGIDELKKVDF